MSGRRDSDGQRRRGTSMEERRCVSRPWSVPGARCQSGARVAGGGMRAPVADGYCISVDERA